MRILESVAGQKYAVDDEFAARLDLYPGVDYVDDNGDELIVRVNLADLIDFLTDEGLI